MDTDRSALPKYVQTAELLIREIASGRLPDGSRLKPERDMAVDLGISVGTLRRALDDLTDKGLLERIQGSGNYIRHRSKEIGLYAFFRIELVGGGGLPTADILSVETMPKPSDLPSFGVSDIGHRIRRLRRLSNKPAALEEIWLDGVWADKVTASDLSESLYYFYRQHLGLWITGAEDQVGVDTVPSWRTSEFGRAVGDTVGFIERWSRAPSEEIAEYSRTWFDTNVARYVARLR